MGRRNPDRVPRLRALKVTPPGFVRLGVCTACGYHAALPVVALLARYGELYPQEGAFLHLRCGSCAEVSKTVARLLRLCDPGCPRQRG